MMSQFRVHFFKENNQTIDIEAIFAFFQYELGFSVDADETNARFIFEHKTLHLKCLFMITPKTTVPDIYRLSPKYLDINVHFDMPLMTSSYMANQFFKFIEAFSRKFHLYIYHPLFEDVLSYQYDVLNQVFKMVKEASIRKDMSLLEPFEVIEQHILFHIFKYSDDLMDLKDYYDDVDTFVSGYELTKCHDHLHIGFHWYDNQPAVIPPFVNVCYFHIVDTVKIINYLDIEMLIDKYTVKVPGTIEGTKVIPKKLLPKAIKVLKKAHGLKALCNEGKRIPLNALMDIES